MTTAAAPAPHARAPRATGALPRRFDLDALAPGAERAMGAIDAWIDRAGLDSTLVELVRVRASQLNGCAYCVDMHTRDARRRGETEQRLYGLAVWRETPYYTPRERAALAWTEAVTLVADGRVPDAAYAEARDALSEADVGALTVVAVAINVWNRVAISQRLVPGGDVP